MIFRKSSVLYIIIITLFFTGIRGSADSDSISELERSRALELHEKIYTLDSHVDIPGEDYATAKSDPGIDHPDLRCDLVKMKALSARVPG